MQIENVRNVSQSAYRRELASMPDGQLVGQEIAQKSAMHVLTFILRTGPVSKERVREILESLARQARWISAEVRRRGLSTVDDPRGELMPSRARLSCTTSPQVREAVEALLWTGLYGANRAGVVERLIIGKALDVPQRIQQPGKSFTHATCLELPEDSNAEYEIEYALHYLPPLNGTSAGTNIVENRRILAERRAMR